MALKNESIKEILTRHGFYFSKSKGQNFLIDANIPEKIARLSQIGPEDGVLEVGPGAGALTRELSRAAGSVAAVELDRRLLPILDEVLAEYENVQIIEGDILKLDIAKLCADKLPGRTLRVCANLPYNITTPALTAFIGAGVFETITVMIQREVAQRICAAPGSSEYGAFTVFANFHAQATRLFDVPPECFMPRPKVWSSVITLTPHKARLLTPEDEARFFRVVRAAFAQRRKTLVNALYAAFGNTLTREALTQIVTACGFNPQIRGERLGTEEFIKLAAFFPPDTKKRIDEKARML